MSELQLFAERLSLSESQVQRYLSAVARAARRPVSIQEVQTIVIGGTTEAGAVAARLPRYYAYAKRRRPAVTKTPARRQPRHALRSQSKMKSKKLPVVRVSRTDFERFKSYALRQRRDPDDWLFVFSSGEKRRHGRAPAYQQLPYSKRRPLPFDDLLHSIANHLLDIRPQGGVIFLNFGGAYYYDKDSDQRPMFLTFDIVRH